jgi:hypothetical protein
VALPWLACNCLVSGLQVSLTGTGPEGGWVCVQFPTVGSLTLLVSLQIASFLTSAWIGRQRPRVCAVDPKQRQGSKMAPLLPVSLPGSHCGGRLPGSEAGDHLLRPTVSPSQAASPPPARPRTRSPGCPAFPVHLAHTGFQETPDETARHYSCIATCPAPVPSLCSVWPFLTPLLSNRPGFRS